MVEKQFVLKEKMNYMIFHPEREGDFPLLVYLHGAGERGERIEHLYRHGVPRLLREGREINAVVLCPQCPAKFVWNNVIRELKALIDEIAAEYHIKPDRILLTGSSMGGYGTWEMALAYRNFFAAIAPVAGGGMPWRCANLRTTPVIAYHGTQDDMVFPECSEQMVTAVQRSGGKAELVYLEEKGHNDGIDFAYEQTDLIERLLQYRRTDFSEIPDVCEEFFD